jgi:hypothetical protein
MTIREIDSLEGSAEQWAKKIVNWLEECERARGNEISYRDVTYFNACFYPRTWDEAIGPIWEDLKAALGVKVPGPCYPLVFISDNL